jgi:hypothetical protein
MGAVYGVSLLLPVMPLAIKLTVHTLLIAGYAAGAWLIIKKN